MHVRGPGGSIVGGEGCGPAPVGRSFLTGSGLSGRAGGLIALLVGPDVASVRLGTDRKIVPRRDPRLPEPWRAAVAFTPPLKLPRPQPHGNTAPAPPLPDAPTPIALDAHDRALPEPSAALASALRTAKRRVHTVPAHGCALLGGPRRRSIDVAPARTARPVATIGPAFRACYVATYDIAGRYLEAALLVDATDPSRRAPDFPGSVPAGGTAVDVPGGMQARRAADGRAWIVVRLGPPDVRRRLLDSLRARLR
jgi:hypothetical protein